eukprot:CAMPEP_0202900532 /NCGR_PEP_ID=MMETSP1392-20130828/11887_1 /ASSEMBLY_ACC=CAM_ASM_000868 /TAXON_ID=225041 /ORGANISM="Chlamydomonas chlamydogama, Strain SAG 11-48b" /LENGTH=56 /DNA_ID=CAMNT_0049586937 /DNA_START=518 /DNA_END=688 /DNA_ORIENTATION=+
MAEVGGGGEALALKHMPQVTSAVLARDLDALHAEADVLVAFNGARDLIVEGRPAAS